MLRLSIQDLSDVSETLLLPLYCRTLESHRPDASARDEEAAELVEQISYDFFRFRMPPLDQVAMLMRVREFDRHARSFLAEHPDGVIVHIGCGLDTRPHRVDNGLVMWYDLDPPPVIVLRKKLLGFKEDEHVRDHESQP